MESRRLTSDESRLLKELATIARIADIDRWLETIQVRDFEDGGMGSLNFVANSSDRRSHNVVVCLAAVQFTDADGVEVIASLNADEDGVPFELDIWKTDFGRLIRIPHEFRRVAEDV